MSGLLERSVPLRDLGASWAAARAGLGRIALVSGEAGIGKTSLVRALLREAGAGGRALLGTCDPLSTPQPLGPLAEVAASLSAGLPGALAEGKEPHAIFQAVLAALKGFEPTLLVIEDAHWADAATLDLLRYLGRRIAECRALLVVTFRDDELGPRHPLRITIGDLASAGTLQRIRLEPLSAAAVTTLAQGTGLAPAELLAQTGGNPFFVTEVIAAGGVALPENVRDAVLGRAARLPAPARATLEAAAVAGASVEPRLLAAMAAGDLSLEPCLHAGLLVGERGRLAFRHELARQAVLGALAPDRLRLLHARALVALSAEPRASRHPATLAHHAAGAGDAEAVLEHAVAAARQAAALSAHREAAAQYERALAFAGTARDAARAGLLEAASYESYLTDQFQRAIRLRAEAAQIRADLGEGLAHGDDLRWLSRMSWVAGDNAAADRHARLALQVLGRFPPGVELAAALSNQSQLCMLVNDSPQASRWGRKAMSLARRLGDVAIEAHAANNVGTAMLNSGKRGWTLLERSLSLALDGNLDEHAARAFTNLTCVAVEQRLFARADPALDQGIAYCDERGLDFWRFYMQGWRALSHLEQGRLAAASDDVARCLSQPVLSPVSRVVPLAVLGRVRALRGDPQVQAPLDEALQLAEKAAELQQLAVARIARSDAAWLAGDDARARSEAEAGLERTLATDNQWFTGVLFLCLRRAGGKRRPSPRLPLVVREQLAGRTAEAARAWRRLGSPFLAACASAEGTDEAAIRAAFSELEALGMRTAAARLSQRLRTLGARAVPRGRRSSTLSHPKGLTAREVEVLSLLEEGLSNAAIGRRLFISPKTVDHHVSAVLGKLGVKRRAEAALLRTRR
jgi:DNA-binding CsgD family transcriptional regulator